MTKDEESIQMLLNAAETDLELKPDVDRIDYKKLFLEVRHIIWLSYNGVCPYVSYVL